MGIFERADVSSVISGVSTNFSMTTTSGFNLNFNNGGNDSQANSVTAMMLKNEREHAAQSFPLSTIKETPGSGHVTTRMQHPAYQQYAAGQQLNNNGGRGGSSKPISQNSGMQGRFRGQQQDVVFPPATGGAR